MAEDKGKPKGAMNAYAAFLQSMRADHKKKHPNVTLDFKAFSKECSEQWKVRYVFVVYCISESIG